MASPRLTFWTRFVLGVVSLALAVFFGAVHLAGWRDYTSILCGQAPTGDMADRTAIYLGMAYVVFYLGFVLVAPVLAIAAGVFAALQRIRTTMATNGHEGSRR